MLCVEGIRMEVMFLSCLFWRLDKRPKGDPYDVCFNSPRNLRNLLVMTVLSFLICALSWRSSRLKLSGMSSESTTPFTNLIHFGTMFSVLDLMRTFLQRIRCHHQHNFIL